MFADTRWAGRTWPKTLVKSHPQDSSFVVFPSLSPYLFFNFFWRRCKFQEWSGTKEITLVPSM